MISRTRFFLLILFLGFFDTYCQFKCGVRALSGSSWWTGDYDTNSVGFSYGFGVSGERVLHQRLSLVYDLQYSKENASSERLVY